MKDIEIIRRGLGKRPLQFYSDVPSDEYYKALERIESLIKEAPKFFSHHDFDGEKLDWLKRTGLINEEQK